MPNFNPKIDGLKPYKPTWNSGQTRTIRVPIALADQILAYARQLDDTLVSSDINIKANADGEDVYDRIEELLVKVDNKESGYKSNAATRLIKELRALLREKLDG
jgi:hypothetical protein